MTRPRYLAPEGTYTIPGGYVYYANATPETTLSGQRTRDRILHNPYCAAGSGGHLRHGVNGYRCARCAQTVAGEEEAALTFLDARAGGTR